MSLKRDDQTFLTVIEANKGIVFKVANAYCRNDEDRKDLLQEILVQLWLSFTKYDESYQLTTWMYRIALNTSISFYRKENRRSRINQPLPDEIIFLDEDKNGGELQVKIDKLYQAIRELKEIDRAVIILYLDEKGQQEISEILGMTVTNVSTKVARIKQRLTRRFAEIGN